MTRTCSQKVINVLGGRYYLADFDAYAYDPNQDAVVPVESQLAAKRLMPLALLFVPKGAPVDTSVLAEAGRARRGGGRPLRASEVGQLAEQGAIVEDGTSVGGGAVRTEHKRHVLRATLHTFLVQGSAVVNLMDKPNRGKLNELMGAPRLAVGDGRLGTLSAGAVDGIGRHTGTTTIRFFGDKGVNETARDVYAVVTRAEDAWSTVVPPAVPASRHTGADLFSADEELLGAPLSGKERAKDITIGTASVGSTALAGSARALGSTLPIPGAGPVIGAAAKRLDDRVQRRLTPGRFSTRPPEVFYTLGDGETYDGARVVFERTVRDLDPLNDTPAVYAGNKAVVRSALRGAANERIRKAPKAEQPALNARLDQELRRLDRTLDELRDHTEESLARETWQMSLRGPLLTPGGPAQWVAKLFPKT